MGGDIRPVVPVMLTADLRPFRLVFLVRTDDPATVEAAFRAASAVWGGWRCPIVPVSPDGMVAERDIRLVDVVGVDMLVNLTGAGGSRELWPAAPLRPPVAVAGLDALKDDNWWPLHPVDLPAAFSDIGRPAHVGVPVPEASDPGAAPRKEVGGVPRLWALAAVGGPRDARDVADLRRAGVHVGSPSDPADLVLAQLNGQSLLAATAVHDVDQDVQPNGGAPTLASALVLTVLPGGTHEPPAEAAAAAVAWWNCRALRPAASDRSARLSVVLPATAVDDERVVDGLQWAARTTEAAPAVFLLPGPGTKTADLASIRRRLDLPAFSGTYENRAAPSGPALISGEDRPAGGRYRAPPGSAALCRRS
jgi:hypothetical protein